jgi:hypothetical protein
MTNLELTDEALVLLRPLFTAVEGACEAWTDDEMARRIFVRGAMEYAKGAGRSWDDVAHVAAELRAALPTTA